MPDPPAIIALDAVTKRFPGVVASDAVSLALRAGEVHVLLGENGAGKSTLVRLLSGLQRPDAGRVLVDGREEAITSPSRALALGIGTVFQHAMLVPSLTVAENMALGGPWWRRPLRGAVAAEIRRVAGEIGIAVDPHARVGALSLGEQQQVEIVRALMRGNRVLLLDEATAMLTPRGAEELGGLMRRLAARGLAVAFVTHKLNEAVAFGDRVTVLRLGRKVGELGPEQLAGMGAGGATETIVRLMFGGNELHATRYRHAPADRSVRLRVAGLRADGAVPLAGISFEVAQGEIFGIAGIDGNGQRELAEALGGQRALTSGSIELDGTPVAALPVRERRRRGLRYVSDDRLGESTVGAFTVALNLVLKEIGSLPFWRRGIERPAAIARHARSLMADFDVRAPSLAAPVATLSGGNVQKAVLARELTGEASVVVFAKPTYGLDVQNIRAIRRRIALAAEAGCAVLLISTDLDEILELCDRVAVMEGGRLIAVGASAPGLRERLGEMMSGVAA